MAKLSVDVLVNQYGMDRAKAEELFERSQPEPLPVSFRVSDKGAVSVYGLGGRWPVTLYVDQWDKLLDSVPRLKGFIDSHRDELARKL